MWEGGNHFQDGEVVIVQVTICCDFLLPPRTHRLLLFTDELHEAENRPLLDSPAPPQAHRLLLFTDELHEAENRPLLDSPPLPSSPAVAVHR